MSDGIIPPKVRSDFEPRRRIFPLIPVLAACALTEFMEATAEVLLTPRACPPIAGIRLPRLTLFMYTCMSVRARKQSQST